MKNKQFIATILICSIVLAPILFFPLSNDLSIFFHSAKTLINGGKLYVDYIDIKPPFGYILFIPIAFITGQSELFLRLTDFLIQLCIVFLLYRLIYQKVNNSMISSTACFIYSLSYVALNFNQTMQLESFMGFLLLLLMGIQLSGKDKPYIWVIRGLLLGFLISIKFTAFTIYFAFIIDDFRPENNDTTKPILKQALTLMGFILSILSTNLVLVDSEVFLGFSNALKYLMIYGSQPPFDIEFLKFTLKQTSRFFADNLSLTTLILFLMGIVYNLKNNNFRLYNFSLIMFLFLLISVILERKYFEYHFLRLYIPLTIIAAYGFCSLYQEIKQKIILKQFQTKLILTIILVLASLFSPIPRWVQTWIPAYYYFSSKVAYNEFYERPWTSSILRKTSVDVASLINEQIKPDDKVLIITNINNQINFLIKNGIKSKFALSCFYLSSFNIDYYENLFLNEIKNANWLVIQTNDGNIYAMGHLFSSYDALRQNKVFSHLFIENFQEVKDFKTFKVFKRK